MAWYKKTINLSYLEPEQNQEKSFLFHVEIVFAVSVWLLPPFPFPLPELP